MQLRETKYYQYAIDVISGDIPACQLVVKAAERFMSDLEREDIYFDIDKANKAIGFIQLCRHTKGKWKGERFNMQPWQQFGVANIFGFYKKDGKRRYTRVYWEMPKKNGKSPLAGAIGAYMLTKDGENTPECYSLATTISQAEIAWKYSKDILYYLQQDWPDEFESFRAQDSFNNKIILFDDNSGIYKPLSFGDNERHDGLSVFFGLIDEYHAHKNNRGYKILSDGVSARDNPLILAITTAGFDRNSACYQHREHCIRVLQGALDDDSQLTLIYTTDEGDDWTDPKTWRKANPNFGVSVSEKSFTDDLISAKEKASDELSFRTKKLNQWLDSYTTWLPDSLIVAGNTGFKPQPGEMCYASLDLASTDDMSALTFDFELDGKHRFCTYYFVPSEKLRLWSGEIGANLRKWAEKGWITSTDGDVTDYDFIENRLKEFCSSFDVISCAYDPYNAKQFAAKMLADGINMRPFSQQIGTISHPTKRLGEVITAGKFEYDGNPVTRWMFGNVNIYTDANLNQKIVKAMKGQQDARNKKVDGPVTWVMALGEAIDEDNKPNKWEPSYTL